MVARTPLALLIAACLVGSATAQTQLPAALSEAVAATQTARTPYAFDLELVSDGQALSAHFEPYVQPRLRLISPVRTDLNTDLRDTFDALAGRLEGPTWCAGSNMTRVTGVHLLREDATSAVYAFQPTRESVTSAQTRRIVDHLRGELTLLKQARDISNIRIFSPRPFSQMLGTSVELWSNITTCAVAPNGRRYASEVESNVRWSMFGRAGGSHVVRRTDHLRPAG